MQGLLPLLRQLGGLPTGFTMLRKLTNFVKRFILLWLLEQTPNSLERYRVLVNAIVSLAGEPVWNAIDRIARGDESHWTTDEPSP